MLGTRDDIMANLREIETKSTRHAHEPVQIDVVGTKETKLSATHTRIDFFLQFCDKMHSTHSMDGGEEVAQESEDVQMESAMSELASSVPAAASLKTWDDNTQLHFIALYHTLGRQWTLITRMLAIKDVAKVKAHGQRYKNKMKALLDEVEKVLQHGEKASGVKMSRMLNNVLKYEDTRRKLIETYSACTADEI